MSSGTERVVAVPPASPRVRVGGTPDGAGPPYQDRWTELSADDGDIGWGEAATATDRAGGGLGDEWYFAERPPHHG